MASVAIQTVPIASDSSRPSTTDFARSLLRFVTCGSVDDGKSTLIGRLLHDAGALFADQFATLESDSRRFGTRGGEVDFALLVDGLSAEREQGITIDVAYRYFASEVRRFIVADSPGHEQYTRNMVTAASTADLAILLVDAKRGLTTQTRRHARIARLLDVGSIVLAVNKMDLVEHDQARFDTIVADFSEFARLEGIGDFEAVPIVAVAGGNIARASPEMPWYRGPTLLELLDRAPAKHDQSDGGFMMPVQWVSRPDADFRGFAGTVARGQAAPGDSVVVLPGGETSRIARIVTFDGDRARAAAGQAITIALERDVDCSAGATLVAANDLPSSGDMLSADLVWFDEQPLAVGRSYILQLASTRAGARIEAIEGRLDPDGRPDTTSVAMNGIARVSVRTDMPIVALPYSQNEALGAFVLIDRASNATVAAGMVRLLGRSDKAVGTSVPIYAFAPGDPVADLVVTRLKATGRPAVRLDHAVLRAGIAADLPPQATAALWRRAIAAASLFADAGVTVALAFDPPPGFDPVGKPWTDAWDTADWVI